MNVEIPWRYRNIVNPWQTPREVRNAVKYLDRLLRDVPESERPKYTRETDPDRWSKPTCVGTGPS